MNDATGALIGLIIGLALGFALLALLGVVLRWLWNTTLPEITGVKPITVVQAIKLIFLSAILFGGHRVVTVETPTVIETEVDRPRI
jgi:hypothetical protein